jgi:phosphate transport system permease protein
MSVDVASSDLASRLRGVDRRTRRRRRTNVFMVGVCSAAAVLAVGILALIVFTVVIHGFKAINLDFFTKPTPQLAVGQSQGAGVANAIVGSLIIVGIATAIALPIGVLVAIFTSEFAGNRASQFVRLTLDILNGVPSVVIGIFVFGLLVVGHGQAAWIAGVALAIIEVPLIARSTQEVLGLVRVALRDASAALGARKWKTVVKVVIPSSLGGIVTGTLLAVARVAGETAPIIFASSLAANVVSWDPSQALSTLPFSIFVYSESPDPHDHELAWAAALLLMLFVLVLSFLGRVFLARNRRKMEGGGIDSGSVVLGRYLGRAIEPMRGRRRDDTESV